MSNLKCFIAFFTLIITSTFPLFSQGYMGIDTLKQKLNALDDPQELCYMYLRIAHRYSNLNHDSTLYYSQCAQHEAEKFSFDRGVAMSYFLNSYAFDELGQYDVAIEQMKLALHHFENSNDTTYLSDCYNNLGVLYSYTKEYEQCLDYYIQSIDYSKRYADSTSLAEVYSNIGEIYQMIDEHSFAAKYFSKALEIDLVEKQPEQLIVSYLDLGYAFVELYQEDKALEMIDSAERLLPRVNSQYIRLSIDEKFAKLYTALGQFEASEKYIGKVLDGLNSHYLPLVKASICEVKAELYLKRKQYMSCINAADTALSILKQLDNYSYCRDIYDLKSNAYFGLKRYKKGHEYLEKLGEEEDLLRLHRLSERLLTFEQNTMLSEEYAKLELQKQLDRKELELITTRYEFRQKIFICIVFLLILILLIWLYIVYSRKNYAKSLEMHIHTIEEKKQELEVINASLHEKEIHLIQVNATKDKFFSIIGHDLKNPFNSIIGLSSVLIEDEELRRSESSKQLLEGIEQAAITGSRLLENLLYWSRSQTNRIKVSQDRVLLREIFENVILYHKSMASEKQVQISISEGSEHIVYADYHMVELIVRNLVSNAIKFSYPEGEIILSAHIKGNMVELYIKDFGRGMSKKVVDSLFFFEKNIQTAGTSNEEGTGLGLVLSKEFVEKNGGSIWAESVEDVGSIFTVSLPKA